MTSGRVYTTKSNGISESYTQETANSRTFLIQKGQLNKYRLRSAVLNEHAESSRESQGTVTTTNIVGQIFRASEDNINGIMCTLESAASTTIDTFETYADSAALQAEWAETDASDKAVLETVVIKTGTKSMKLPMSATVLDEWINTVTSANYTDNTFSFDFQQSKLYASTSISFFVGDGTNTKSISLVMNDTFSWQHFDIDENAMAVETNDATANPPNMGAITKIGFRLDNSSPNALGYVDNIAAVALPGQVELKLWDMGTTIPTTAVTSIDDGTQYEELGDRGFTGGVVASSIILDLVGGKRLYTVQTFVAGAAPEIPSNTILTKGNYYALTFNYVDTNVTVFGPNTSYEKQYYKSGYAFTAPDEATAVTKLGVYNHCMFGIFSTADVHINTLLKFYDAAPGSNANEYVFIEDKNMKVTSIITGEISAQQTEQLDFSDRFFFLPKGGKFEVYHNDDFTDSASQVTVSIGYIHKKSEPYL